MKGHKVQQEWVSLRELATYLGIHYNTVNNYVKQGILPAPKVFSDQTRRWHLPTIKATVDAMEDGSPEAIEND